jgi:MarR family transcriptional regulator, lower aerobic nicotinate degradation pathway regulator
MLGIHLVLQSLIPSTMTATNDVSRYAIPVGGTISETTAPKPALPAELLASTGFLLARVGYGIKMRAMQAFEEDGFNIQQYGVLALLGEGATETQSKIADVLGYDRSQLVGELDELEERGLVVRRRDPQDRRRHMVSITSDGKRQLARMRAMAKRIEDDFFQPLDEASRNALHDALLQIACCHDARYKRES